MNLWNEFFGGLPEGIEPMQHLLRVPVRLAVAILFGGWLGYERQHEGKRAGMRTHMMVALGACLFTLVGSVSGMGYADLSRIIQGIAAGVGFLGAGTILKQTDTKEVHGLTTAATIWLTAAAGMSVGAGWYWPAFCGVGLAWLILDFLHRLERWTGRHRQGDQPLAPSHPEATHGRQAPDEDA